MRHPCSITAYHNVRENQGSHWSLVSKCILHPFCGRVIYDKTVHAVCMFNLWYCWMPSIVLTTDEDIRLRICIVMKIKTDGMLRAVCVLCSTECRIHLLVPALKLLQNCINNLVWNFQRIVFSRLAFEKVPMKVASRIVKFHWVEHSEQDSFKWTLKYDNK